MALRLTSSLHTMVVLARPPRGSMQGSPTCVGVSDRRAPRKGRVVVSSNQLSRGSLLCGWHGKANCTDASSKGGDLRRLINGRMGMGPWASAVRPAHPRLSAMGCKKRPAPAAQALLPHGGVGASDHVGTWADSANRFHPVRASRRGAPVAAPGHVQVSRRRWPLPPFG